MAITLDEVRTRLHAAGEEGGDFRLVVAGLATRAVDDVAKRFLPGAELRLAGVRFTETPADGGTIVVAGTGVETPFAEAAVEASFHVAGGEAVLRVAATGGLRWTLGAAFPALAGTVADDFRFAPDPAPNLRLRSDPDPGALRPVRGAAIAGTLDLETTAGGLGTLFGGRTLAVHGSVDAGDKGASVTALELDVPVASNVELGFARLATMDLGIGGDLLPGDVPGTVSIIPRLAADATLLLSAGGAEHPLPLSAEVSDLGRSWRFRVGLDGTIEAAWEELSHLVNGVAVHELIPASLRLDALLRFDALAFDVDFGAATPVQSVSLGVRNASPWTVLRLGGADRDLVVEKVGVGVIVREPFGRRAATVQLDGEVRIGAAGSLVVHAGFPDFSIFAGLKEGTTLHLDEAIEYFAGPGLSLPRIELETLELEVSSGAYRVAVEAALGWQIGSLPLALEAVGLELDHAGGETSIAARGEIWLAGVGLSVTAEHAGAGRGWHFEGGTLPGESIPIGELMQDLVEVFGVEGTLPDPVAKATLSALRVAFDTGTRAFTFFCETRIPLASGVAGGAPGRVVDATLEIAVRPSGGGYEKLVRGTVKVDDLAFDLAFDSDPAATRFLAGYRNLAGGSVNLGTLLAAVTDDPAVVEAAGSFSIDLKDALVVYDRPAAQPSSVVFGADIGTGVDLSNLPLVGRAFPTGDALRLAFQPVVATRAVPAAEMDALRALVPEGGLVLPAGELARGLSLATRLDLGGTPLQFALPFGIDQGTGAIQDASKPAQAPPAPAPAATPGPGGVHWLALQRTFGPLHLERIGVRFEKGDLWFYLDGGLAAAGLTLELDGLGVGIGLADIQAHRFDPRFTLRGVGIDFRNDALEIGGALLHLPPEETGGADEYDGMAVIKVSDFGLTAIGSYAELNGFRSLFLYAALNTPIGGPPYFFVMGLAAGFGFNRDLRIPAMDQLIDFPLVAAAVGGAGSEPVLAGGAAGRGYLLDKLARLHDSVPVRQGQFFFALGLRFTTFKVLDCFALVTASVGGQHLEFDLLGIASVVLPPVKGGRAVAPLAELQLALRAAVVPDEGYVALLGELTRNSYILSRDCRLTGGFALAAWFLGPHAGDFVATVGGYHPDYRVPDHYPRVPRVGFNWSVSSSLTLKGGIYFALLPHAAMAGGDLEAVFESGPIRAWFRAGAHFLVAWEPFHYDARVYVDMGVQYTFDFFGSHTISADLGADLHLWGPDFSGEAHIHLSIVSFTIEFGAAAVPPPALKWPEFRDAFLPTAHDGTRAVAGVSVAAGLVGRAVGDDGRELLVVNPRDLVLETNSLIPSTRARTGAKGDLPAFDGDFPDFGIGPMGVARGAAQGTHTVHARWDGNEADALFAFEPLRRRAPGALWGGVLRPQVNGESWIEGALTGIRLRPAKPPTPGETHAVPRANLGFDTQSQDAPRPRPAERRFADAADSGRARLRDRLADDATAAARAGLLSALGIDPATAVVGLDGSPAADFLFPPRVGTLAAPPVQP